MQGEANTITERRRDVDWFGYTCCIVWPVSELGDESRFARFGIPNDTNGEVCHDGVLQMY